MGWAVGVASDCYCLDDPNLPDSHPFRCPPGNRRENTLSVVASSPGYEARPPLNVEIQANKTRQVTVTLRKQ